jgi:CheY-like chemotaxis protein/HPt (histidine-containing phosphotransfer) domain-containing protein
MIDLLGSTELNEEQKNYVQVIKKSSETLLHILNDILDLSKIEAGKMQLKKAPALVNDVFSKLYSLYSQQAVLKDISFNIEIDEKVPQALLVDETRLLQILTNLTSNAIKFSDYGDSVKIHLATSNKPDHFKVEVTDSGIGISREDLEKLFSSFSQIDNSSTKTFGGTGLGLAISKELCKLMNGEIGVYSSLGKGSTFWFTFQATEADPKEVFQKNVEEDFNIEDFFGEIVPNVLLVDDNMINRQVAGEILKKAGCKVDFANNGYQAIERVKAKEYDIIFMDIQMPEMDGVVATRKIKEQNLQGNAPVVAMTAYSMKEDKERFLNQGLDDYISKPIKARQLLQKVRNYIIDKKPGSSLGSTSNKKRPEVIEKNGIIADKETQKLRIVDPEVIEQLKKYGGNDLVAQVMLDFHEETSEFLKQSSVALANSNWDELKSILHTLKGNAGTLGLEQISVLCKEMELKLKNNIFDALTTDFEKLELSFEDFSKNYEKIINL